MEIFIDRYIWRYWIKCGNVLSKHQKRRGTEKTRRLSSQVPHKLGKIDKVSWWKVVPTARRADAVRCMGCGINDQIVKRLFLSGTSDHNV